MATHGTFGTFDPEVEDWPTYAERLRHYFIANDVTDIGKKRSILLTVCGAPTYKLLRSLAGSAAEVNDKSFDDLSQLLESHFAPKTSEIVQRYHFYTRTRGSSESVAEYVAALRQVALNCNFGDKLSEMLRDRLACGVNHKGITRKLLAEPNLTFDKALSLAQMMEAAERDSKKFEEKSQATLLSTDVHALSVNEPSAGVKRRQISCYRCGGPHLAPQCMHIDATCHVCQKRGHLARVCRSTAKQEKSSYRKKPAFKSAYHVDAAPEETSSENEEYNLFTLSNHSTPYLVDILLNDAPVRMELVTGAAVSIINNSTFQAIRGPVSTSLQSSTSKLRTYTGHHIQVMGVARVNAKYSGRDLNLSVHVVSDGGPNLMGRDWLEQFDIDFKCVVDINSLNPDPQLRALINTYSELFTDELGCSKNATVKLIVHDNAKPKFFKPRTVPLAVKKDVDAELQRLQDLGIISPVQSSTWAAPVVPVKKRNGTMRLCGDYKLTINKATTIETYPLPRVDELFAKMSGGKYFTKLDLANAFLQLPLDSESKKYVTINTHRGLFEYNRLPFGVSSAPAIFQRHMDTLFQGVDKVCAYIDDILLTGSSLEDHLQILGKVLQILKAAGLRLNKAKCSFLQPSIEYLGHIIDQAGIHPTQEKVQAIKDAPAPQNVAELRSFLGMINYYSKFLPNLSAKLSPLYSLLHKQQKWQWNSSHEQAFSTAKDALQGDSLLVHYDPAKPMVLTCDASPYGVGAVLSHVMDDQQERPIAYVSRTLSSAEKNYSQLEKEALAIVFAVKKFHNYLFGRHFLIESDHRPLAFLFGEDKKVPQMASSRIQRWALTLAAYKYSIRYKAGKDLCNADALSRLPRPVAVKDCLPEDLVLLINHLNSTSIDAAHIKQWTAKDSVLSCVKRFVETGWPTHNLSDDFKPYVSRKNELSVLDGCLLWASRVVVPHQGRQSVLDELHDTHSGISKMKALARSYIWWPGIDRQIEELVQTCSVCQRSRPDPSVAPLHPWEWPSQPWSRIHLDFFGPFLDKMFLVIIDAHSKWIDTYIMCNITSSTTIEILKVVFANHGLPRKVVTDNGPSFVSDQFRSFLSQNGIVHVTSAPYHPSSNGLAERAVQTVKHGLMRTTGGTIQERLSRFLFTYRITPHSTTGAPPASLLMGRRLRGRLDSLFPDFSTRVENRQVKQAQQHDTTRPLRKFSVGETVFTKDFSTTPPKWVPGTIAKITGPLSYLVEVSPNQVVRRHGDAIRNRKICCTSASELNSDDPNDDVLFDLDLPTTPIRHNPSPASRASTQVAPLRRSARQRPPPDRLGF